MSEVQLPEANNLRKFFKWVVDGYSPEVDPLDGWNNIKTIDTFSDWLCAVNGFEGSNGFQFRDATVLSVLDAAPKDWREPIIAALTKRKLEI